MAVFLQPLDAAGTQNHLSVLPIFKKYFYFLQIGLEQSLGPVFGMGDSLAVSDTFMTMSTTGRHIIKNEISLPAQAGKIKNTN